MTNLLSQFSAVVALIGMVGTIIMALSVRRKNLADAAEAESSAASKVTAAATSLIAPLEARIAEQERRLHQQELLIADLRSQVALLQRREEVHCQGIKVLTEQLLRADLEPAYMMGDVG